MESSVYPRVLVLSNECFSKVSSNGRTLGSMFYGWPQDRLAQFCIKMNFPDNDLCNNYYCVTDKEALKAFISFRKVNRVHYHQENSTEKINKQTGKTAINMLCRNLVWAFKRWHTKEFVSWIMAFNPDVILLQSSDSAFMLNMAYCLSREFSKPLAIFNTEGYYLFRNNWMRKSHLDFCMFPLYKAIYKRFFRRTVEHASLSIYANQLLKDDYSKHFTQASYVIYTGSTVQFQLFQQIKNPLRISYLGNFGFDRYKAIISLGKALSEIDSRYMIDVYGNASENIQSIFNQSPGINYRGFVSYNQVKEIIIDSDILIHAENQSEYWKESLKYGFSTKIADSVSSGKLFILYASSHIACSQYIQSTGAGIFVESITDFKEELKKIIKDENYRYGIYERAAIASQHNHDIIRNAMTFKKIIQSLV